MALSQTNEALNLMEFEDNSRNKNEGLGHMMRKTIMQ